MQNVHFPFFKMVRFINTDKEGIAKSRASTGELVINMHYWNKLKPEHKIYILCHEEGHIKFDTRDEIKADEWASQKYFSLGFSISQSVHALSANLDRNSKVHVARAWLQYNRALQYDYEHNKNNKAFREVYENAESIKQKLLQNKF
jgi:hypothetical protein